MMQKRLILIQKQRRMKLSLVQQDLYQNEMIFYNFLSAQNEIIIIICPKGKSIEKLKMIKGKDKAQEQEDMELMIFKQSRAVQLFQKQIVKELENKKKQMKLILTQKNTQKTTKTANIISELNDQIYKQRNLCIQKIESVFSKVKDKVTQTVSLVLENAKIQESLLIQNLIKRIDQSVNILSYPNNTQEIINQLDLNKKYQFKKKIDNKKSILNNYLNGTLKFEISDKLTLVSNFYNEKLNNIKTQLNNTHIDKIFDLAHQLYFNKLDEYLNQNLNNFNKAQVYLSKNQQISMTLANTKPQKLEFDNLNFSNENLTKQSRNIILPQISQKTSKQFEKRFDQAQNPKLNSILQQQAKQYQRSSFKYQNEILLSKHENLFNKQIKTPYKSNQNNFNPYESIEQFKEEINFKNRKRKNYKSSSKAKEKQIQQNLNNLIVLSQKKKLLLENLQIL